MTKKLFEDYKALVGVKSPLVRISQVYNFEELESLLITFTSGSEVSMVKYYTGSDDSLPIDEQNRWLYMLEQVSGKPISEKELINRLKEINNA